MIISGERRKVTSVEDTTITACDKCGTEMVRHACPESGDDNLREATKAHEHLVHYAMEAKREMDALYAGPPPAPGMTLEMALAAWDLCNPKPAHWKRNSAHQQHERNREAFRVACLRTHLGGS